MLPGWFFLFGFGGGGGGPLAPAGDPYPFTIRRTTVRGGATLRFGGTSPILYPPLTAIVLSTRTTSLVPSTQTSASVRDTRTKAGI